MRVSAILTKRLTGMSLREIGELMTPPVTAQAIWATLKRALGDMLVEPLEAIRTLELLRLDELHKAIWQNAVKGDIASVDRCLAIAHRRSRLLGLDTVQAHGFASHDSDDDDLRTVQVRIVGDPEAVRREHLLQRRIAALGGDPNIDEPFRIRTEPP